MSTPTAIDPTKPFTYFGRPARFLVTLAGDSKEHRAIEPEFTVGDIWLSRDWTLVKITAVNEGFTWLVNGRPLTNGGPHTVYSWDKDGKFSPDGEEHRLDLISKVTVDPKLFK